MSEPQSDGSSHEQQLNAILHDYLQAVDAGQAPDKEEVLRRHPDLADELAAFFADQDRMNRLAQQMRITNPTESPAPAPLVHYVGDYELLEEIARGGMGVVFKARQISLNRLVAVKMILSGRLAEPAEVERFRREAGAAAGLDHPNIVPIYEVGEHQGHHYYSMKLIEGDNLARKCRTSPLTTAPRRCCWRRSHGPCSTPMNTASCTATSSPATSCWTPPSSRTLPTSAWPAGWTSRRRCRRRGR